MTWIRLGQDCCWRRFAIAALTCAEVGVIGALVAAILPLVSEVFKSARVE